jgi:hypothetical protein
MRSIVVQSNPPASKIVARRHVASEKEWIERDDERCARDCVHHPTMRQGVGAEAGMKATRRDWQNIAALRPTRLLEAATTIEHP